MTQNRHLPPCFSFYLTLSQWCHHALDLNKFGEHAVMIININDFYFNPDPASNNRTPTVDPWSSVWWTASQPFTAPASGQVAASVCVCVRVHVSLHKEHKEDAASSYPVPLLKNEPKGTKSNFVFWFLSSSSFYPNVVVVVCELCASEFSKGHVVFLYRLCCSAWQSRAWFTHDDAGGDPVSLPLRSVYINYSSKLQSVWP